MAVSFKVTILLILTTITVVPIGCSSLTEPVYVESRKTGTTSLTSETLIRT